MDCGNGARGMESSSSGKFNLDMKMFYVNYEVNGKRASSIVLCDSKPEAREIVKDREQSDNVEFNSIKEVAE